MQSDQIIEENEDTPEQKEKFQEFLQKLDKELNISLVRIPDEGFQTKNQRWNVSKFFVRFDENYFIHKELFDKFFVFKKEQEILKFKKDKFVKDRKAIQKAKITNMVVIQRLKDLLKDI